MTPHRWTRLAALPAHVWAVVLGVASIVVIGALVLWAGDNAVAITAVVTGPLLTAALAGPRRTEAVGVVAFFTALVLGVVEDLSLSGILLRLALVVIGAGSAALLADARMRREQAIEAERAAREADLRSMFESSSVGMLLVDNEGAITDVNAALVRILGYPRELMIGQQADARIHPEDGIPQEKADLIAGNIDSWEGTVRVAHRDGSWRWAIVTASLLHTGSAQPTSALVQVLDVTAEKHAEAELSSMIQVLREGVVIYDTNDVIQAVNPAVWDLYGVSPETIQPGRRMPQEILDRLVDEHGEPVPSSRRSRFRALTGEHVADEVRGYEHPDGTRRWFSVASRRFEIGGLTRVAVSIIDITDRHTLQQALYERANHDPLTGLLNRRAVDERLELANAARDGGIALLFLDLDGFKQINDTHGHAVGDEVLQFTAEQLRAGVRPVDAVGRWAGDEFLVVCPGCETAEEATSIARRVLDLLAAEPAKTSVGPLRVPISIGVCHARLPSGLEAGDLLRVADDALYEAKAAGGATDRTRALG